MKIRSLFIYNYFQIGNELFTILDFNRVASCNTTCYYVLSIMPEALSLIYANKGMSKEENWTLFVFSYSTDI